MPDTTEAPATWTTQRLLTWMTQRFEALELDAPRVVAEMLLSHVLGCERMRLYMEVDRTASPEELKTLRELVRRACDQEPVQYLVGRASFFSLDFAADRSTLIPQPCTEDLVSAVLDHVRARPEEQPWPDGRPRIADVGTGTGCIAISLAKQLPDARFVATDVSADALALAEENARRHGVIERIEFVLGAGLEPLAGRFDVICSNPPYISDGEWNGGQVDECVRRHVPESATRGGADGLDVIRPIVAGAGAALEDGGLLALEIGHGQREAVLDLAKGAKALDRAGVRRDHEGHWRVFTAMVPDGELEGAQPPGDEHAA